jgi:hypothetical protein
MTDFGFTSRFWLGGLALYFLCKKKAFVRV